MVLLVGLTSLVVGVVSLVAYVVLLVMLIAQSPAVGLPFLALNVYGFRYVRRGWTES